MMLDMQVLCFNVMHTRVKDWVLIEHNCTLIVTEQGCHSELWETNGGEKRSEPEEFLRCFTGGNELGFTGGER